MNLPCPKTFNVAKSIERPLTLHTTTESDNLASATVTTHTSFSESSKWPVEPCTRSSTSIIVVPSKGAPIVN